MCCDLFTIFFCYIIIFIAMKVIVIEIFLVLLFMLFLCVDKKIVVVLGESMMSDYIP